MGFYQRPWGKATQQQDKTSSQQQHNGKTPRESRCSVQEIFSILNLKENSPIHGFYLRPWQGNTTTRQDNSKGSQRQVKSTASQDNGKASQRQGKSRQQQVNSKTRPWKDKTTARHLESPDTMSKRSCQYSPKR